VNREEINSGVDSLTEWFSEGGGVNEGAVPEYVFILNYLFSYNYHSKTEF
jgi:hypothetical protein